MIVEQLPRKISKIASHVGLNKLGLKVNLVADRTVQNDG